MIRSIGAALLAVWAFSSVHAAEEELYLGFGLGSYDASGGGFEGDTVFAEVAAGVQINKVASVEVSYQHFDKFNFGPATAKVTASNLSLVGEKGIDERLGLIGRVFVQFADVKVTINDVSGSENSSDLGFGAGITYRLGEEKNNTLRLEYRTVDPGASGDEHYVALGIIHYFD